MRLLGSSGLCTLVVLITSTTRILIHLPSFSPPSSSPHIMRSLSLACLCRPLASAVSGVAVRFHSTLSFDSPLSISCTLCNYFTALGYYPFNLLLYTLFASRPDGWLHCTDLMRYQLALLLLFVLYVLWRLTLSTAKQRLRDGSLLVLVALQLWVDWHGWHAGKQAVTNFQAWAEADDEEWTGGLHTSIDHSTHSHTHLPIQPPPLSSHLVYSLLPSSPYQLDEQCGSGFSIHLVRVVLANVAFTAAVAMAFVLRLGGEWMSEETKERAWAVWDGGVEWLERRWAVVRRRVRRVKQRYGRQQQQQRWQNGSMAGRSHDEVYSESDADEDECGEIDEEGGTIEQANGRRGSDCTSVRDRLLP